MLKNKNIRLISRIRKRNHHRRRTKYKEVEKQRVQEIVSKVTK